MNDGWKWRWRWKKNMKKKNLKKNMNGTEDYGYKRECLGYEKRSPDTSVVVCRFAFRPKFARVVSFRSRQT
ncbi:hypothetical protein T01_14103 [Trichinella spiralis]|uniref:Uncharacterized protein n=1 Tax=Trichinella spiralis TaxID=6334 RepID=A0A0V1B9J8_TRISP|nr:hypothetical protein T01_14103 [Trichinella spiralis]